MFSYIGTNIQHCAISKKSFETGHIAFFSKASDIGRLGDEIVYFLMYDGSFAYNIFVTSGQPTAEIYTFHSPFFNR